MFAFFSDRHAPVYIRSKKDLPSTLIGVWNLLYKAHAPPILSLVCRITCCVGSKIFNIRLARRRTVNQIILQPKIDELMQFAAEQWVSIKGMELICQKCQKMARTIEVVIPIEDSLGIFFNSIHSSRSLTELRLFLLRFWVELPTRNIIDQHKKSMHPPILVQEIKNSVQYTDLICNTVKG